MRAGRRSTRIWDSRVAGNGPARQHGEQPDRQRRRVDEVSEPGGRSEDEHQGHRAGEQQDRTGHRPRRPDDQRQGDREASRREQDDDDRVAEVPGPRDDVAGQRAGGLRGDAGQPQRNMMVFSTSALGWTTNGPTQKTTTAMAVSVNEPTARLPSRIASRAIATSRAGQAVAFIAAPTPSASPASTGLHCQRNPKTIHRKATIGTSVPPTASSKAMTGQAATKTAQRNASRAPPARSASQNTMRNTTPNQIRGSVSTLGPSTARGTPNSAMIGRYGL